MPLADARLLAIEEDSRFGKRAVPGNRGGWPRASWFAVFALTGSVAGWFAKLGGFVADVSAVELVGCSCWNLRISASFLWCCSSRWRVRRACQHDAVSTSSSQGRASGLPLDLNYSALLSRIQPQPNHVPHSRQLGSTCGSRALHFSRACGPGVASQLKRSPSRLRGVGALK